MPYRIRCQKFKLYSTEEFARLLDTREENIYRLIFDNEIKIIYVHNLLRITPWEVDKFIYKIYPERFLYAPRKEEYFELLRKHWYLSRQKVKSMLGVGSSFSHFFIPNEIPYTIWKNEVYIYAYEFYEYLVKHEHYFYEEGTEENN